MPSRKTKWVPHITIEFEEVPDAEFARILAELGEIVYNDICDRQSQLDPSIATSSEFPINLERKKVANE